MNSYMFEQIAIGQSECFTATVTDKMIHEFYSITDDCNPLHIDEDFAIKSGYTGRVAYGMLTASFLSTLAGVYLPGKYSVIHETDIKFPAPVYAGDVLTFSGEVIRKDDTYKIIELKVSAVRGDGKKVLRGRMKVGVTQ